MPSSPGSPGSRPGSPQATSRIDHRMKDKDGKLQTSPPKDLTKLYPAVSPGSPPAKLCIEAPINSLKLQQGACGVYTLQKETREGKPVWKHATEDLCIVGQDTDGEHSWAVARFTTSGSSRMQLCMRVNVADKTKLPCGKRCDGEWEEWNGRDWAKATTVKCRSSWHGWGLDKLDRTRLKFSPTSPNGAY